MKLRNLLLKLGNNSILKKWAVQMVNHKNMMLNCLLDWEFKKIKVKWKPKWVIMVIDFPRNSIFVQLLEQSMVVLIKWTLILREDQIIWWTWAEINQQLLVLICELAKSRIQPVQKKISNFLLQFIKLPQMCHLSISLMPVASEFKIKWQRDKSSCKTKP